MKKNIGTLALLALGVALVLAPAPARAACPTGLLFGQATASCGGGYCYVTSPGLKTNASIQGTYWSASSGNPASGAGADNGTWSDSNWLVDFSANGNLALNGGWNDDLLIDGCIGNDGSTPAMVIALTDRDAAGKVYAAFVCNQRDVTVTAQFDQGKIVPAGDIALKPLALPFVVSTFRVGNEASITVASPNYSSLFYSDGSVACGSGNSAAMIPAYDVFLKTAGRGASAPTDRAQVSGGWTLAGSCPIGGSCTVSTTCGAVNCDVYVALAPKSSTGFRLGDTPGNAFVGPNSVLVQAGPVLANPPKVKIIKKRTTPPGEVSPQ